MTPLESHYLSFIARESKILFLTYRSLWIINVDMCLFPIIKLVLENAQHMIRASAKKDFRSGMLITFSYCLVFVGPFFQSSWSSSYSFILFVCLHITYNLGPISWSNDDSPILDRDIWMFWWHHWNLIIWASLQGKVKFCFWRTVACELSMLTCVYFLSSN